VDTERILHTLFLLFTDYKIVNGLLGQEEHKLRAFNKVAIKILGCRRDEVNRLGKIMYWKPS
jgi:hypothetical protein